MIPSRLVDGGGNLLGGHPRASFREGGEDVGRFWIRSHPEEDNPYPYEPKRGAAGKGVCIMTPDARRWRKIMDWINPVEWFAWIYGKFFQGHGVVGGLVVIGFWCVIGLALWIRGVDKYKEDHPKRFPSETSSEENTHAGASLSEAEKQEVVQRLIGEYKKTHPQSSQEMAEGKFRPMLDWVNRKLTDQGRDFRLQYNPRPKSRAIVVEGSKDVKIEGNRIEGFDEGIVIVRSEKVSAERNIIVPPKRP